MSTKITLKNVVISYPNLFNAKKIMDQGEPKFSTAILIAKNDKENLKKLQAAIDEAKKDDKLKGARKIDTPLNDGDEEKPDDKYYAGCYYINAKASENHAAEGCGSSRESDHGSGRDLCRMYMQCRDNVLRLQLQRPLWRRHRPRQRAKSKRRRAHGRKRQPAGR